MASFCKKLPEFVTDKNKQSITITRYRMLDVSTSIPSWDPRVLYRNQSMSIRHFRDVNSKDRVKCNTDDCHIYVHNKNGIETLFLFKWMTEKEFLRERNMYVKLRDVVECHTILSQNFYEVQSHDGDINLYLQSRDKEKVKLTALQYDISKCDVNNPDYETLASAISTLHYKFIMVGQLNDKNIIQCGKRLYFQSLEHFIDFRITNRMLNAKRSLMIHSCRDEHILSDLNTSEKFMAAMSMGNSNLVVKYAKNYYKDEYASAFITRFLNLMEFDPKENREIYHENMLILIEYFDWVLLAMYVTKSKVNLISLPLNP